jgi:hypothetical protein
VFSFFYLQFVATMEDDVLSLSIHGESIDDSSSYVSVPTIQVGLPESRISNMSEVPKTTASAVLKHDALPSSLLLSGIQSTRVILSPDVLMGDQGPFIFMMTSDRSYTRQKTNNG